MNIKSLLLGSAAALVAVSGARAADAIIAAEPEPVEYVRVCDAFGVGYFYIPGTETCLRIGGYVQYDISGGDRLDRISNIGESTYNKRTRVQFNVLTASETELGTLRTDVRSRWDWSTTQVAPIGYDTGSNFSLNWATIQLGGLTLGKKDSFFTTFTGYAGNVINDDLAGGYGPFDTNLLSYEYTAGAFRAGIAIEQGNDSLAATTWGIDDYMPHVVAGIGYTTGMFQLAGVFAYDTRDDIGLIERGGWAAKVRADVAFNDAFSMFAIVEYGENSSGYTTWANGLATDETWSVLGGASFVATEKMSINGQVQWVESNGLVDDEWSFVANVAYTAVPGLTITPELVYHDTGVAGTDGEFGGQLRVRRSF